MTRAPKKIEKNSLFFIFVDEFSKLICCFLFSLIFSTNSTNQRNQRNEFNESTNKIFVDFTKFQRIFNENFNESTKILKKSSNSLKFWLIDWNLCWKFVHIFTNQRIQPNQYFFQRKRISELIFSAKKYFFWSPALTSIIMFPSDELPSNCNSFG